MRGDDGDRVVALLPAEPDRILQPHVRAHGAFLAIVIPAVTVGRGRPPRVAHQEEGRAVGILECMAVGGGTYEPAAARVGQLVLGGPVEGLEGAALPHEPGVGRFGPARPAPLARRGSGDAHAERAAAVPEAMAAPREARALQIHPDRDLGIGVLVLALRLQNDLVPVPDVDCLCHAASLPSFGSAGSLILVGPAGAFNGLHEGREHRPGLARLIHRRIRSGGGRDPGRRTDL
jgi:hypothetical protein